MLRYILRRVLYSVPVLLVASFLVYGGIRSTYDPLSQYRHNPHIRNPQQIIAERTTALGLNDPLVVQWWNWLRKFVSGDMGVSEHTHEQVSSMIWRALGPTLQLVFWVTLVSVILAVTIGVYSAVKQYSVGDYVLTGLSYLGIAMPTFWLALLCMMVFGVKLGWLPISGIKSMEHDLLTAPMKVWDYSLHLVMPVLVAALTGLAGISRYMRSSMLEVVRQDYVTTARAKGLAERDVIYRHALRNALLPVITILGLSLPGLIGGSVIFETIFAIPGMGRLFYDGVMMRDYPLVMGVLVIGAVLTLVGNLLADISYAIADPRLRRR